MPVIQALPRIAGMMAGRSPTSVSETIRPTNSEPMADACVIESPDFMLPRAWSAAMRAESPVPVAERSSRPGATTTAFRLTAPTPCHGSAIWTMLTPAIDGFSGCSQGSCSRAAARIRSPASERSRASWVRSRSRARPRRRSRTTCPVGHVDGDRAHAVDLEGGIEAVGKARDVRELDAFAAAVPADRPHLDHSARRLEAEDCLRLGHGQNAGLEQYRRRADRVRAGHRRILGGRHDDEPRIAVRHRCRNHQVRVTGDAAARLAQEKAPKRVAVLPQVLHLLEDGIAGRRKHPADDDIADLTARVAADNGDGAKGTHRARDSCRAEPRLQCGSTYGGDQVSTWSVLRQSCKPRSPVGLVKQPGKQRKCG